MTLWFCDAMIQWNVPSILQDLCAVVQWDACFWSRMQSKLKCNVINQNKNKESKRWGKEKLKYIYWSWSWNCPQLKEFAWSMSLCLTACRIWFLFLCLLAGLHCRNSITDYEKSDLYVYVWNRLIRLVQRTIKHTSLHHGFEQHFMAVSS